jgi:hypothetical protein
MTLLLQDVDPGEHSYLIGYSNPKSQTAACNCLGVSKFSEWTDQEAIQYILSCFYYQNRLRVGTLGCCARQQGKKDKVTIINTIISSVSQSPYELRFTRYSDAKQNIPIDSKMTIPSDVAKEVSKIRLTKSTAIKEPDVTLELLLLLRFFRFMDKGFCNGEDNKPIWYLRKSEIYLAWSGTLGESDTLPSQGRSRKKK